MQICIHRGQNQIGGSIIEIKTDSTRIFLDVGIELDESEHIDVPQIEGLFCGKKNCDAVFISHYHGDHIGLLDYILPNIPLFMGESAFKIFSASADYRNLEVKSSPIFIRHKERVTVGNIGLTPYICDHSAYDSYMFLIEADGKTVLYTGDFRANGRLDYSELLEEIPEVDAVIIEGTSLSREEDRVNIREEELEDIAVSYLSNYSGPVFVMMSAMNIDRLETMCNVAKRTERIMLEDIYTADIASGSGKKEITPSKENGIYAFMTGGDKQYARLQNYKKAKIGKETIAKKKFVMCIRQSMKNYLDKLNEIMSFQDGVLFYGMWKGYLEQEELKIFIRTLEEKGIKMHVLHTSGHADTQTIDKLLQDIKPKTIIPVHTENPAWYSRYESQSKVILFDNVLIL